jgi:hypothetical protein
MLVGGGLELEDERWKCGGEGREWVGDRYSGAHSPTLTHPTPKRELDRGRELKWGITLPSLFLRHRERVKMWHHAPILISL